jgi:hypothetical protein
MPEMPLAIRLKRLRRRHQSSRDLYIYSELCDSVLIPSTVTASTASPAKTTGDTPPLPSENSWTSTSKQSWKLLFNENDEDDLDNNCTSSRTTTTTSNSFLPESLAETKTLDQMFRLLERLDGRRSRNSSLGRSRNSNSRNSNSNNNDDGHSLLPKVSLSQSYDTADTDVEDEEYMTTETTTKVGSRSTLLWFSPENTQTFSAAASAILQRKGVTWADQQAGGGGNNKNNSSSDKRLVTRYTYTPLPEQYVRVVILLLHPVELKFEFVHAEFDTDVRLTVSQVLKQLSSMATDPLLQELEWGALCLRDTQREMINCMTLQEYNLYDGSMLIAVPVDYAPRIVLQEAGFFLKDKVLRRVVRRAKMTGVSLQRLQADPESNNNNSEADEDEIDAPQLPDVTTETEDKPEEGALSSLPSSRSFDASVVVNVPSIQDDDFDDFWGREDDRVHATTTTKAITSKSQQLVDHMPAAFERFIAADDEKTPFDFTGDLVRLAPLPTNSPVVQVQPPETATTPTSSSEPAVVIESKDTGEDLSACSSDQEEEDSTFADVLDGSGPCLSGRGDELRLIHSF